MKKFVWYVWTAGAGTARAYAEVVVLSLDRRDDAAARDRARAIVVLMAGTLAREDPPASRLALSGDFFGVLRQATQ